ncbi:MAG: carboxypeptidase-like regulatory domain-containing protein [Promethearchaeota archaeon]
MKCLREIKRKYKKNIRYLFSCIFIIILLNLYLIFPFSIENSFDSNNNHDIKSSGTRIIQRQWLKNSDFSTQDNWFFTKGSQGDNSTIDANISNNSANYKILGNRKEFSLLSGTINTSSWFGWEIYNNGDKLLPDLTKINETGCYTYHYLDENENGGAGQVHNFPSVHFKRNVSLMEDLLDYEISTVALDVIFNASVNSNVDADGDAVGQFAIGDSATFYIEITDLENSYAFRVAEFKTTTLGQDNPPILTINDTSLPTVSEGDLITALNLALEKDPSHSYFTIIMGLDIYCEDNDFPDYDLWNYLIFKSFNLTFTYESKVEQFSSISWNQIGDKIEGADVQIKNATLEFNYKIEPNWPTILSPFTEIRMIINNNKHSESIKLSDATLAFQEAKPGGFDITSLISKGVNISVSLQVFIANTFGLDKNITISIDDVYLNVSLIETFPDIEPNLELFLNGLNKTSDPFPFIEIPKNQNVNLTVKYYEGVGIHIRNAQIQLEGVGFVENFIENLSLQQYTVLINSSEKLILGNNLLTIRAQKINYVSKTLIPTISVRKINTEFNTLSGESTINLSPGGTATIRVLLNDTDNDRPISGAVVLYSWYFGQGSLTESGNDGIYEGIIRNVPEGSYEITISAYGIEDYNFKDYKIILNAISPSTPDWTWLILLLSGGILGLAIFISLYQFHFKYPPMVRKIRKLRKKIRKGKRLKPIITLKRKEIIESNYKANANVTEFEPKLDINQIDKINKQ